MLEESGKSKEKKTFLCAMKFFSLFLFLPVTTKRHLMMADVDEGLFSGCVDADIKEKKQSMKKRRKKDGSGKNVENENKSD